MTVTRAAWVLAVAAASIGCRATAPELRPSFQSDGAVHVYLQPLSDEAGRLRFAVAGVAAVADDGRRLPLGLLLQDVRGEDARRERLLARGTLPTGSYSGLSIAIASAALAGDGGDVALAVGEPEVRIEVPFVISRGRAAVVSLRLHGRESVVDGYRFAPEFSAAIPEAVAIGLIGLAADCRSDSVTLFDRLAGRVAAVVPVGRSPRGIAVDPLRRLAYVAVAGEDTIRIVDLQQMRATDRIQLFGGDQPVELVVTPDRRTLVAVNSGSNSVSVIDAGSLTESARVKVGDEPGSIVLDRTGRLAFVFNTRSDSISVIDLTTATIAATIGTDATPIRGQLNRAGDRLYVIHGGSPYLAVVEPGSLAILTRVYVGSGASALKIDPRTDRLYLARRGATEIDVYDPQSLLPVDSIRVGGDVAHVTIDDQGNNLGLALPEAGEVRVLRLVGRETVARVEVAGDPCWVTFVEER